MGKFAAVMDQCGHRDFIDLYLSNRSDALQNTLSRKKDIVAEEINPEAQM